MTSIPAGFIIKNLETEKWIIDTKFIYILRTSSSSNIYEYNMHDIYEKNPEYFAKFNYFSTTTINEYYFDDIKRKIRFTFYWFM